MNPSHPSEAPRREQAQVVVFHMADVDSCDASYVIFTTLQFFWANELYSAVQIFYELLESYKVSTACSSNLRAS